MDTKKTFTDPSRLYCCLCYFTGTCLRQLSQSYPRRDWSRSWSCSLSQHTPWRVCLLCRDCGACERPISPTTVTVVHCWAGTPTGDVVDTVFYRLIKDQFVHGVSQWALPLFQFSLTTQKQNIIQQNLLTFLLQYKTNYIGLQMLLHFLPFLQGLSC